MLRADGSMIFIAFAISNVYCLSIHFQIATFIKASCILNFDSFVLIYDTAHFFRAWLFFALLFCDYHRAIVFVNWLLLWSYSLNYSV